LLERDVVPMFYERSGRVPLRWVDKMKASIGALSYFFNTNRMVAEYTDRFYMPLVERYRKLSVDDFAGVKRLSEWRQRLMSTWAQIRVESVEGDLPAELHVGQTFYAQATVFLGELNPDDVCVELYLGLVNPGGELAGGASVAMEPIQSLDGGRWLLGTEAMCGMSGVHGYTVRILPKHPDLVTMFQPGYIRWAD
jgi:starch phosphorylase